MTSQPALKRGMTFSANRVVFQRAIGRDSRCVSLLEVERGIESLTSSDAADGGDEPRDGKGMTLPRP